MTEKLGASAFYRARGVAMPERIFDRGNQLIFGGRVVSERVTGK